MNIKKRFVIFLLGTAIIFPNLCGCGNSKEQKEEPEEEITIEFWENEVVKVQKVYDELIKEFQKKNEDIIINRTHYSRDEVEKSFDSDEEEDKPDIALISSDRLAELAKDEKVIPVTEFLEENSNNSINEKVKDTVKLNGKEYMIPVSFNDQLVLIYNKKLVQSPPETFSELLDMSKRLINEKRVKYGLVMNVADPIYTIPFLGSFGGRLFNESNSDKKQLNLDTPSVREWMTFIKKLQAEEIIPKEPDFNNAEEVFKEGNAAFLISGPSSFVSFEEANMEPGAVVIPTINGKYPAPYSTIKGYVVSAGMDDEKKQEALKKFIEFLNKKDNIVRLIQAGKQVPVNIEVAKNDKIKKEPLILVQMAQIERSIIMPPVEEIDEIKMAIFSVQQDIMTDRTKPEDAPLKMQKKVEEGIKLKGNGKGGDEKEKDNKDSKNKKIKKQNNK